MHRLISSNQLVSYDDIKSYLAFTVKVMQLCTRYTWGFFSVLMTNLDSCRLFIRLVPWTYDSNHLHTVHLVPRIKITNFGNASFGAGFRESNNTVLLPLMVELFARNLTLRWVVLWFCVSLLMFVAGSWTVGGHVNCNIPVPSIISL